MPRISAILRPFADRTTALPAARGRVALLAALPETRRLPAYTRLIWALARDARVSTAHRTLLVCGVAYLVSPIDVLPDAIPGIGEIDDAAVALALFETVVSDLPAALLDEKLRSTGITREHLDADLARIRATTPAFLRGIAHGLPHLAAGVTTVARTGGRVARRTEGVVRRTERIAHRSGHAAGRATAVVDRARDLTHRHRSTHPSTKEGPRS
jgi:uncharacterized membrane protein YkvA (DUF1232 family)